MHLRKGSLEELSVVEVFKHARLDAALAGVTVKPTRFAGASLHLRLGWLFCFHSGKITNFAVCRQHFVTDTRNFGSYRGIKYRAQRLFLV